MPKPKNKYYVVWEGHEPGIYGSWTDCQLQIKGFPNAKYKGFPNRAEAKKAFNRNYFDFVSRNKSSKSNLSESALKKIGEPNLYSISVDAASSGNPGKMEYRGVDTQTKKQLFIQGPFPQGTNNIGEFLAIVHGLALLKNKNSDRIIYTDSRTAMSWVRKKICNTKLKRNAKNKSLFELVDRAVKWLQTNDYKTKIVKWETKAWGEIPADFGRK